MGYQLGASAPAVQTSTPLDLYKKRKVRGAAATTTTTGDVIGDVSDARTVFYPAEP